MNKFFKDPWNQLALIVFAMSLSYILLKYEYYESALQRIFAPGAASQIKSLPAAGADASSRQPQSVDKQAHQQDNTVNGVTPSADLKKVNDTNQQSVDADNDPDAPVKMSDSKLNDVIDQSNQQQQPQQPAQTPVPPPSANVPHITTPLNGNVSVATPSVIPTNAGSPALAAAITQVRSAYNAQFQTGSIKGASRTLNNMQNGAGSAMPLGAAGNLPPPTQGFSPNDIKTSGKGFVKSLVKKSRVDNEWILDINNGPGSDSDSINQVMFSAKKGDTIRIRNGRYHEKCKLRLDVNIIGESQSGVVIDSEDSVFADKENFTWQNFTLNLRDETRYGYISLTDSNVNIKNITLTNAVFSFTRSKVNAESMIIKNSKTFGAVINMRESIGTFSKFKVENLDGDVFSLRDDSEATISDVEASHVKGSVVAVYKSIATVTNIKAEDVDSFAFHFAENTKPSLVKQITCINCKYGVYITNSTSVDVDGAEIFQAKRQAFVIDKSTSKLSNLKIDYSDNAISVNQSNANISNAVIKGCRTGVSVYDSGGGYRVSNVYATGVTMLTTSTPWDWNARSNSGSRISGSGNVPEIKYKVNDDKKQGKYYVRY